MIDVDRIKALVLSTTTVYRKDAKIYINGKPVTELPEHPQGVVEIFDYPEVGSATAPFVDMHFVYVSVQETDGLKDAFVDALDDGTFPEYGTNVSNGLSYIQIGAELFSQELALRFMALGIHLGLWELGKPSTLFGIDQAAEDNLIGLGFLYAIGWQAPVGSES